MLDRLRGRNSWGAVGRLWRSRDGAAIAEMAIVFPVLLLLLIGVVDYGRLYYTSITVANAARAGAEYGASSSAASINFAGMKSFAQGDGLEAGTLTLAARNYCECGGAADASCTACAGGVAPDVFVEVTASKMLKMLLKYPGLPDSISIVRKATFRSQ